MLDDTDTVLVEVIDGGGVALRALTSIGPSVSELRAAVERHPAPVTPAAGATRADRVRELAIREALTLGASAVSGEHLLLAIIRDGNSVAAMALRSCGLDLARLRRQVLALLDVLP